MWRWVSPLAGLDGFGKSRLHRDSIQPVASRYTDCAIQAHIKYWQVFLIITRLQTTSSVFCNSVSSVLGKWRPHKLLMWRQYFVYRLQFRIFSDLQKTCYIRGGCKITGWRQEIVKSVPSHQIRALNTTCKQIMNTAINLVSKNKGGKCTYNVTLRHLRETIVDVEKQ